MLLARSSLESRESRNWSFRRQELTAIQYFIIISSALIVGGALGGIIDLLPVEIPPLISSFLLPVLIYTAVCKIATRLFELPEGLAYPRIQGSLLFGCLTGLSVVFWTLGLPFDPSATATGIYCGVCAGIATATSFNLRGGGSRPLGWNEASRVLLAFPIGAVFAVIPWMEEGSSNCLT